MRAGHLRLVARSVLTMVAACGGRTGLVVPSSAESSLKEVGPDAASPVDSDRASARDAPSPIDAGDADVPDVPSPIDSGQSDATTRCGDGHSSAVAYVLDASGGLYRYYPATGREVLLGTPACSDSVIPWTMTAGRDHAYIVYTDWTIFRVELDTLACSPTPFTAGQLGLDFEFGVALTGSGASEQLYYYGVPDGSNTAILAVSDTVSFRLSPIGPVKSGSPNDPLFPVNLTSDNNGHLFAYAPEPEGDLLEIDPTTGAVLLTVDEALPSGPPYATLAYEGSVYLFADTVVEQFKPPRPGGFSTRMIKAGAIGAGSYVVCP